ncbi:MAG: dTMP kinase [Casimicrobiaceae bacterium]
MSPSRGYFITLEGIDGAGKSTHVAWLAARIAACGHRVVTTREPGGTPLGEHLRKLLLHQPMTHDSEALLMFAARRDHLALVVRPALERGDWVLCDRFTDATFAYQGGGHGVRLERIAALAEWVEAGTRPDRTLLFDVAPAISQARLALAQGEARQADKFEREDAGFFTRVRDTYLARARAEPQRFRVVDSGRSIEAVRVELDALVGELDVESRQGSS